MRPAPSARPPTAAARPAARRTLHRPPPAGAPRASCPTSTRFMWRMNASASIQNSSTSVAEPRRQYARTRPARSARARSRSGVNAVKSWVPTSAAAHAVSTPTIEPVGPPQRPPGLERARAPAAPAPGSSRPARSRRGARRSRRSGSAHDSTATSAGSSAFRRPDATPAARRSSPPGPRRARRRRCARRPSARTAAARSTTRRAPARARPAPSGARLARPAGERVPSYSSQRAGCAPRARAPASG